METEFWRHGPFTSTTRKQDPPDLLAFLSYAYDLNIPSIDISSPNIERKLGQGTSAVVHLFALGHKQERYVGRSRKYWHIEAGTKIAIKRSTSTEERHSMLNEFRILSHSPLRRCPNVVDIIGWSVRATKWSVDPLLITEASTCGDLSTMLLSNETPFNVAQAISISIDISRGLHAIHSSGIIHGDLKSSNILLFTDEEGSDKRYTAKICDFGFSVIRSDYDGDQERVSLPRTCPYNAPECKDRAEIPLSQANLADMFSYGMVLWDVWSHGFVLKSDAIELETKKRYSDLQNEMTRSITVNGSLTHQAETTLINVLWGCLQTDLQLRTGDLSQIFPKLYAIASEIDMVQEKDVITDRDTLTKENGSEAVPQTVLLLGDEDELLDSTIDFGRRLRCSVLTDLKARLLSSSSSQLFTIHYLISFCYLTGYGTEISLPLAVEHMAKSAVAGFVKAFALLPKLCRALDVIFPEEVLGLSQADAQTWTTVTGYVHPRVWREISSRLYEKDRPRTQRSISEIKELEEYWKVLGPTVEKPEARKNKSIPMLVDCYRDMQKLRAEIASESQDLYFPDNYGNSALYYACFFGDEDASLRLIKENTRPLANAKGVTPLHWLCQFPAGTVSLVLDSFLENGADVNAVSKEGGISSLHSAGWFDPGTPLSWAVSAKRKDVVIELLSRGANPHLPNYMSALAVAASRHEHEILEELLRATVTDPTVKESLGWAVQARPLADRIMRHGERYKDAAARTISLILEHGAEQPPELGSVLFHSILGRYSEGNVDIMDYLLQSGWSAPKVLEAEHSGAGSLTPLHCAMAASGRAMFRKLVEYGADVNHASGVQKYTCLHGCSRADSEDSVYFAKLLLDRSRALRADLEARDVNGYTPFMLACRFQRADLAKYLLSEGADAYAIDNDGYTVISACVSRSVFQCLQEVVPDLAEHDYICHPEMGVTALHHVAEWDEMADADTFVLVAEILHAAPHILDNTTNINGRSALHSAVRKGNVRVVEKLLHCGADLSIRDQNGMTAIELGVGLYSIFVELGRETEVARLAAICSILKQHAPVTISR